MSITLTPEQQAFIENRVQAGLYESPRAMIDKALDTLEQQERRLARERAFFEREIKPAWEAAERGETFPLNMDEIQTALKTKWDAEGMPR